MYGKDYCRGVRAGNFINEFLHRDDSDRMTREERHQIREDNAYITLHGREEYERMKRERGY